MVDTFTVAFPKDEKLNRKTLGELAKKLGYRSRGALLADLVNRNYRTQVDALFIVHQVFDEGNGNGGQDDQPV